MMNFSQSRFTPKTLLSFHDISPSTRNHLKNVYGSLMALLCMATMGAYYAIQQRLFFNGYLTIFSTMGLLFGLRLVDPKQFALRTAMFLGFGFLEGLFVAPLVGSVMYQHEDGFQLVLQAFAGASIVFLCFSLCALYAQRRSFLFLGSILSSAISLMLIMSFFNFFFQSVELFWGVHVYLGLLVFSLFVIFDTQCIIEKAEMGDRDHYVHAVELFLDFVSIFIRILAILNKNKKEKKNSRR